MVTFWTRKDYSRGASRSEGVSKPASSQQIDGETISGSRSGLVGYLDAFDEGRFQGWAADLSRPIRSVYVEVRVGSKVLRRVQASLPRTDVNEAGHSGDHGFDFVLDPVDCNKDDEVELVVLDEDVDTTEVRAVSEVVITGEQREVMRDYMRIISDLPRSLTETQDVILFDVQDLINFLQNHNSVTGIQRVVGGIIQTTLSRHPTERRNIHFCMMSDEYFGVRLFDENSLQHIVAIAMAGGADQVDLTRTVLRMRRKAPMYRPKQGDCFFIGGAYWIVPDGGPRLNALKSLGVSVATYIYDLIPITAPEWVTDATRREVAERAIDILLLSDFLLTISVFVKTDVERLMGAELNFVKPVIAAPLPHQLPPRQHAAGSVRQAIKDLGDFVLCVCTLEGRKNHILLYRIWAMLLRQKGFEEVPYLVLVGKWGWNIQTFQQACLSSNFLDQKIKLFANVGDDELSYLYNRCLFTVFPSFMEGWGLPVGESLSAGKLCVASSAASIPEVGGDFCEYINPHDFFASANLIGALIDDRETLEAKGKNIREKFVARTWEDYANGLFATIAEHAKLARDKGVAALSFEMAAENIYEVTSTHLSLDETIPWRKKAGKFVRASGWGMLEDWGVWSNEPRARISFNFADTIENTISLFLELRVAPQIEVTITIEVEPDGRKTTVLLANKARWVSVPNIRNNGRPVAISLTATFVPLKEPSRELYIGLSRMVFCESKPDSAADIPVRLLQAMGLFAGSTATTAADVVEKGGEKLYIAMRSD